MNHLSSLGRRAFAGSVLSIVCVLSAGLTAGQGVLGSGGEKSNNYKTYKDPAGRFELEYPSKDWRILPSGGSNLTTFTHKDGPTLYLEHLKSEDPFTPEEIGILPEVELARLKELEPKVKDFMSDMAETKAGRGVVIRYTRVDAPEAVMQFSILVNPRNLYRLRSIVSNKLLPKYEPIVKYMMRSFIAKAETSTP